MLCGQQQSITLMVLTLIWNMVLLMFYIQIVIVSILMVSVSFIITIRQWKMCNVKLQYSLNHVLLLYRLFSH